MLTQYAKWPESHFNAYWDSEASGDDRSSQVLRVDISITAGYSLSYQYIVKHGAYAVVNQMLSDVWSQVHQELYHIILEFIMDVDDSFYGNEVKCQHVGTVTLAFLYVVAFTTAFIIAMITGATAFCRYVKGKHNELDS